MPKLLFLAGSARKDSHNKKLARLAEKAAQKYGAQTTLIDLADFPMPIYDGDLEAAEGLPEHAKRLRKIFSNHDGFFIASPEYNSSISPLLKNSLDWISRKDPNEEAGLNPYKGKVAALGAASIGVLGGLRGLVPLRMMLGNIGVIVTATQIAVGPADQAFDADGNLSDERQASFLNATIEEFVSTAAALNAARASKAA